MTICSRCPNTARPGQRYCGSCHADYQREWRARRRETPVAEFSGVVTGFEIDRFGLYWVAEIGGAEVRFVSSRDDLLDRRLTVRITTDP